MAVTAPLRISMILPVSTFPVLSFIVPPPPMARARWRTGSSQISAKALDPATGLFQRLDAGRVGDAEEWRQPERGAMHHGHALFGEERRGEILVIADLLAF